jgi:hypothetical protein
VNFTYFLSEPVFAFVLDAVDLVANEGWKLLPWYRFDAATGLWHHRDGTPEAPMTLDAVSFDVDGLHSTTHRHHEREPALQPMWRALEVLLRISAPQTLARHKQRVVSERGMHIEYRGQFLVFDPREARR